MKSETFAKLKAIFGPNKLVELVMLMGNYAGDRRPARRRRHAIARRKEAVCCRFPDFGAILALHCTRRGKAAHDMWLTIRH